MYNVEEPKGASNCRAKYAEKVDDEAEVENERERQAREFAAWRGIPRGARTTTDRERLYTGQPVEEAEGDSLNWWG